MSTQNLKQTKINDLIDDKIEERNNEEHSDHSNDEYKKINKNKNKRKIINDDDDDNYNLKQIKQNKKQKEINEKEINEKEIEYTIKLKNYELANDVFDVALLEAFPEKENQLMFLRCLLELERQRRIEFERIEKILPNNRRENLFFEAKEFKKKILTGIRSGNNIQIQRLEKKISDLEE